MTQNRRILPKQAPRGYFLVNFWPVNFGVILASNSFDANFDQKWPFLISKLRSNGQFLGIFGQNGHFDQN